MTALHLWALQANYHQARDKQKMGIYASFGHTLILSYNIIVVGLLGWI